MQTVNGKLIATDRQELDLAKEQILKLDQRCQQLERENITWKREKSDVMLAVSSIKSLTTKVGLIEQRNKLLVGAFNDYKNRQQSFWAISIASGCVVLAVFGYSLVSRPASLGDSQRAEISKSVDG